MTVSPGKGGLGTFAPLLDAAGNSVKGQLVAKYLSEELGMDLFVSQSEDYKPGEIPVESQSDLGRRAA